MERTISKVFDFVRARRVSFLKLGLGVACVVGTLTFNTRPASAAWRWSSEGGICQPTTDYPAQSVGMWEYPLGTMSGLNLLATSTPSYVAMGVCPIELGPASVEIWDESPVTIGHVSARLRLDSAAARAVLTQLESHSATSDSYCTCDYIAASQAPGFLHRDHFWDGIAAACQGCNDSTWVVSLFLRFNGAQRSGSAERLEIRRLRTYDAG